MQNKFTVLASLAALTFSASISGAATMTDHFDTNHDYVNGTLSGTIWGTKRFTAGGVADANITNAGVLTLTTGIGNSVGWDGLRDYGPFMAVINISGDFRATVEITSQLAANNSAGGLMARRSDSISSSTLRNTQEWFTTATYQQATSASGAALIATNMIGSGDVGNLAGNVYNTATMTSTVNTAAPIWLELERVGNTFNTYYSTDGVNFTFGTSTNRPDMNGYAVQVGLYYGLVGNSTTAGNIQFDDFSLITIPEPASIAGLLLGYVSLVLKRRSHW